MRLVNGIIEHITEIICPCFRRAQINETSIQSDRIILKMVFTFFDPNLCNFWQNIGTALLNEESGQSHYTGLA